MSAKVRGDRPDIVFLSDLLRAAGIDARVVLPITDPSVAHHAALGGFATIYLHPRDRKRAVRVLEGSAELRATGGGSGYTVLERIAAARELGLPGDRIGDLVVLGGETVVFGKGESDHDLSSLHGALRSNGSEHEADVPFWTNAALGEAQRAKLAAGAATNADIFDFLLNP